MNFARTAAASAAALLVTAGLVAPAGAAGGVPGAPRTPAGTAFGTTGDVTLSWTAPASAGGGPVTDYGVDRSADDGATWSPTVWLGSTARTTTSATVAAIRCPNVGGGATGTGCRYRIRAKNVKGPSPASAVVKLWASPTVPRTLTGAPTDSTFGTASLAWVAPTNVGGFTSVTYSVEASVDGAAATVVGTTTATNATVPCTGALSCVYTVKASTGAGTSAASGKVTLKSQPGNVQSHSALTQDTNLGAGTATVDVSWYAPTVGMTADHYDLQSCAAAAGATNPCPANGAWSAVQTVPAGADPVVSSRVCAATGVTELATCYYRVRAVNARGGASAWQTVDVQPWAAYGVRAIPGPTVGKVTVSFGGPSESGLGAKTGTTQKRYRLYRCTATCQNASSWVDTGLTAAYPPSAPASPLPSGSSPYLLGVTDCAANTTCSYRVVFTNGEVPQNLPSVPTAAVAGTGAALTLTTPTSGSTVTTPVFAGSCTIGEGTVTIGVVGTQTRSVTTACTAAGTYSTGISPALGAGGYFASATQHGGYITSSATAFTVDSTAPVVTVTQPAPGLMVGTASVPFGGACEAAAGTVTVTITGTPPATLTTACSGGTWSTSTTLPDGAFTVRAGQTDGVGNTGTSATSAFTVDTVAPTVTLTAPTAGQQLATHTPTVTGACETASGTVTVTITGTNAPAPFGAACTAGAWTTTASALPDGGYSVRAAQTDTAGNTGTSPTNAFTVDTTAPVVTVTAPTDGAFVSSTSTTFAGACTTGDGSVAVTITGAPTGTLSTACSGGAWSIATPVPDGAYTVTASQTDAAGNTGTSPTNAFTVDTTPPDVTITTPAPGANRNTHAVAVTGLCSDGDGTVTVTVTGAGAPAPSSTACVAPGTWATSVTLGDGGYTVHAAQTDTAGNTGTSTTNGFTVDTTAPTVTVTSPANGAKRAATTNAFAGACETASGTVTVTVTNTGTSAVTTLTPSCVAGGWTTASSLTDGGYTVHAAQTDAAGNTGTSATNGFTVDTVAPVVSVTNPASGAARNSATNAFGGACTTGDGTVTITVTNTGTSATTTLTSACTASAWSAGTTLADASYTVKASQTDGSGNVGTSATVPFAVDTVAPTVTVTNPTTNAVRTGATNAFGGACATGDGTVTVTVTNTTTTGVTTLTPSCNAGAWTTSTSLGDAPYTVKAAQTDAAGNAGTSTVVTFRVDTTAPTVAISYPVNNASYNASEWVNRAGHCTTGNICGTASDAGAGVANVKVTVQRSDGQYWNGSAFQVAAAQVTASGTTAWNITLGAASLTNGSSYTVTATATDGGGLTSTNASLTFAYDTTGPSVSSVTSTNKNWALASGDTFVVTFNGSIDAASLGGSPTLTITDSSNNNQGQRCNGVTTFRISGLMSTSQSLGAKCAYINQGTGGAGTPITYSGSFGVSGAVVTFTVGSCTANCTVAGTAAGTSQTSWTFTPAATVLDNAGNGAQQTTTTIPAGAVW